jgi:hypothetical protein
VYIPPQGSKEGAEKKAGELRALGVSNYFIMSDNSPLRWGFRWASSRRKARRRTSWPR